MKINDTKCVYRGERNGRTYVAVHERSYQHNGKDQKYFVASRRESLDDPVTKRPDAVAVVGIHAHGGERRLVMTREFRVPIGRYEYSFPAGLIDPTDYLPGDDGLKPGVGRAAVREFKEETGLDLKIVDYSPMNLYSSAGFTDESTAVVLGQASGDPSTLGNEECEEIEVKLLCHRDLEVLLDAAHVRLEAVSKLAWPFLYFFNKFGLDLGGISHGTC